MAMEELRAEVAHNVEQLRAELAQIDDPDAAPPESGLAFHAYQATDLAPFEPETGELIAAFYQSLSVVLDGHPGFLDADFDRMDAAYRIVLASAVDFGEQLMARFRTYDEDEAT